MGLKKWAALACVVLVIELWPDLAAHRVLAQNSPFVLPVVKRDSLLNGLQLITLEQGKTGTVSAHLRINTGALFDLANKGGLADITAGMLLRGGGGFNAKAVADIVEQSGLTVSVATGWDATDVVISGPADSLDTIVDLLGKLVIAPTFDQKDLDALKAERVATLNTESRDDALVVRHKAMAATFGSYPFGRPARGTVASIGQISRQDLQYFHNRFYIANNSALIVTGDASSEQVTRLGRSKLGAWKKGEKVPPTFRPAEAQVARRVFLLDRTEEQPAQAVVAQVGLSRRADDYLKALVMTEVLTQQALKTTSGHPSTTIETDLEARLLAGPLSVRVKSAPADLPGDLEAVLDTMTRMQTSPAPDERVEAAKSKLITAMTERLKTTDGAAQIILDIETYGLGRDYVIHYADRVNAITPADVQRAAQTYLKPQGVTIVIAGPASRFETLMKKIGTVAVVN
ncbi:MAG TPA: pitrilysin family protein [Blastocatellia bacterium]|nr:pitrilysin family protein [Blastocatellia bacterium]